MTIKHISQKEKERKVCESVGKYIKHGLLKSEAVRRTMSDFNYATEAAIYGILRRNNMKEDGK
jgi:hypothetical protein